MLVGPGTHSRAGPGPRGWVPFWEGEDWGSAVLAPSGPTPAPGRAPSACVWAWGWGGLPLEAAERTLGRWGSERRPGAHLFRAKLVGRGQAPWSRPRRPRADPAGGLLASHFRAEGPAHVGRLGRCLEPQLSLLITWRGLWTGPRLGLGAWFSVPVPLHHVSWARLGVDAAVYTCGSTRHPPWERRGLAWVSLPKVSPSPKLLETLLVCGQPSGRTGLWATLGAATVGHVAYTWLSAPPPPPHLSVLRALVSPLWGWALTRVCHVSPGPARRH